MESRKRKIKRERKRERKKERERKRDKEREKKSKLRKTERKRERKMKRKRKKDKILIFILCMAPKVDILGLVVAHVTQAKNQSVVRQHQRISRSLEQETAEVGQVGEEEKKGRKENRRR